MLCPAAVSAAVIVACLCSAQAWFFSDNSETGFSLCSHCFYRQTPPQGGSAGQLRSLCHSLPGGRTFATLSKPTCNTAVYTAFHLSQEWAQKEGEEGEELVTNADDNIQVAVPALLRGDKDPVSPTDSPLQQWDSKITSLVQEGIFPQCSSLGGELYMLTGAGGLGAAEDGDEECQMKPLWSAMCCTVPGGRRGFSMGLIRETGERESEQVSVKELEQILGVAELFSEGCGGTVEGAGATEEVGSGYVMDVGSGAVEEEVGSGATEEVGSGATEEVGSGATEEVGSGATEEVGSGAVEEEVGSGATEEVGLGATEEVGSGAVEEEVGSGATEEVGSGYVMDAGSGAGVEEEVGSGATEEVGSGTVEEEVGSGATEQEELQSYSRAATSDSPESSADYESVDEQETDYNASSTLVYVLSTTMSILKAPLRPVFSTVTQLPGQVTYVLQEDLGVLSALPGDMFSLLHLLTSDLLSWMGSAGETLLDIGGNCCSSVYYCFSSMAGALLNSCHTGVTGMGTLAGDTVGIFGDVFDNAWWVTKFFGGRLWEQSEGYVGTVMSEMGGQAKSVGGGLGKLAWRSGNGMGNVFRVGGGLITGVVDMILGAVRGAFGQESE